MISQVICIDGVIGVGKTTQVQYLNFLLKKQGVNPRHLSLKEESDLEVNLSKLNELEGYLKNGEVVIVDGSIATDIVDDMITGLTTRDISIKHKRNIQKFEDLNQRFKFTNILLTPNKPLFCFTRAMSMGYTEELVSMDYISSMTAGLLNFDELMICYNLKFHDVRVKEDDFIIEIADKIIEIVGIDKNKKGP